MILGQNQTCAFFCGLQLDLDQNIPGFSFFISDRFFFWFLFKKIKVTNYWEHNRETIDSTATAEGLGYTHGSMEHTPLCLERRNNHY